MSKIKTIKEKRILQIADQERHARAHKDDAGNMIIEGYAAVFNQRSRLIFEHGEIFYEMLERSAFDDVLAAEELNVVMAFEHGGIMARLHKTRGIKTLELSTDDYGLKYRANIANTTAGRDLYELVQRGDLFENSFIFSVGAEGDRWSWGDDGTPLRTITKVRSLHDVSVVIDGAYANTDLMVAARSLKEYREQEQEEEPEKPTDNYFHADIETLLELEK